MMEENPNNNISNDNGNISNDHNNNNNNANTSTSIPKYRSNIPSLVAAFSAALTTGGTTYAFGLYGNDLKRSLRLSAGQLDTISTAFFFAGLFSWIPGLIADKFGTRFTIALGGIFGASSLLSYWIVAIQYVVLPKSWLVPVLSVLGIAVFFSCALVTGSVFKTIVVCCGPGTKGSAVGAAKGYVGLGSGAYACLFESIRVQGQSNLGFLPMAAFFFIVSATVPALVLLPTKQQMEYETIHDCATPRHFHLLYMSLAILAVLVITNSLMELMEHTAADDENDDDDQYSNNSTQPSSSVLETKLLSADTTTTGTGGGKHRHYVMAFLLVAAWLGPVYGLLYLPTKRRNIHDYDGVIVLDDDGMIEEGGNNENNNNNNNDRDESEEEALVEDSASFESNNIIPEETIGGGGGDTDSRGDISLKKLSSSSRGNSSIRAIGDHSDSELTEEEIRPLHLQQQAVGTTTTITAGGGANSNGNGNMSPDDAHDMIQRAPSQQENDDEEENLNLVQMLRTPSALLMLWTTTLLVGSGTLMTNEIGEMVESLGFADGVTPASLALFSVAQAGGRVATGALSESALNWNTRRFFIDNGIPRPFFLVVASCVGFGSHMVLGMANHEFFFVLATTASGVAFGMVWPLMVLITGEVFGTKNAGANYMFYDGFTSAIGTLLITKLLAQDIYEKHIDPAAADQTTCLGVRCYQATHVIVALLSLSCVLTSGAMLYTSRRTYNKTRLHRS